MQLGNIDGGGRCALSDSLASIESYLCRELSVNCSALQGHVVRKVCRIEDFGTIPLPKKLLTVSHDIVPVLPVIPVLVANLSWQCGQPL